MDKDNLRFFALAAASATLIGCMTGPDFKSPAHDAAIAAGTFRSATVAGTNAPASKADETWWKAWNDPMVSELVAEACATNISLAEAATRVRQARAALGVARGALYPSLGISASASVSKTFHPDSSARSARGGGQAGWEIDLFGGNRRAAEAAEAEFNAARYEEALSRLALEAETAGAYVELKLAAALLGISRENVLLAEQSHEIAKAKDASGLVAGSGLAATEAALASARAALPEREAALSSAARAVEALLARPPFEMEGALTEKSGIHSENAAAAIPVAPALPATTPARVVARRPDVMAAEERLHAATARIGIARAARYPSVNLAASATLSASSLTDWSRSAELALGPSISVPLFAGGALAAAEERTRAAADEALLAWRDSVLGAVHEAQEAWTRLDAALERRCELETAAEKEKEALEAATALWKAGSGDYEAVIARRQALLSARQSVVQNAADQALFSISLFKALGGAP